jgi:hypothetical protein
LNTSPVTLSTPLKFMMPLAPFTSSEPGKIEEAIFPAVFSVHPAKEAATSEKLVLPPGADGVGIDFPLDGMLIRLALANGRTQIGW